ncbi:hypothetical protein O181_126172 [Austropuccinia psidii MF-1]|uniref:Uncharacterized protein n=1 Tax=Austropuccinia psidii MF-1 TaxID=1389203 RepID=A0A9Q3KVE4_9BASI|nr:hypothetical protein [Austropuccinia psidii MF-1]
MGDPFFNLFTVSSSNPGESTPLAAASPASPVFSASTAPTSPSLSPPASPLSAFANALTISPQSTNSDGSVPTEEELKYNFGLVFSDFDSAVADLGCLMELVFVHGRPPHSHECTLESIHAGVIHLVHLYRQLKE